MFLLRGLGVSLSMFLVVYTLLSLAVAMISSKLGPRVSRWNASSLFALRVLPLLGALAATLLFTLPSFLWLEPRSVNEPLSPLAAVLGGFCALVLTAGIVSAVVALRRTSCAVREWLRSATELDSASEVPVFRTGSTAPVLTVAGVFSPHVLVSKQAVSMLTPEELRSALNHEMAHVRRRDNLRKLIYRFAWFPGMRALESAWGEAAEMAADDAAVSSANDALDLAAALIKLSRSLPSSSAPALTTALVHSSAACLSARVERLSSWPKFSPREAHRRPGVYAMLAAAAVALLLAYPTALTVTHEITEWLMR